MREITANPDLVACCGLYCGACSRYLKKKCDGCRENAKATWCKVRSCCLTKEIATCADCDEFNDPKQCKKFHNAISRLFGLIFRSDRPACIACIRHEGREAYATHMAARKLPSLKR